MKSTLSILLTLLISSSLCRAQQTTAPTTAPSGPMIIRLTLHPMATSQPALRYELLPPMTETKAGDAAYKYELADAHFSSRPYDPDGRKEGLLLDAPRDAFPIADAADFTLQKSTRWIDDAARCENAHFDSDFRNNGISTLLPYLNCLRSEANVVAVAGRLAIAKGDYASAQRCIQTNLSMARQLNDNPFLVQGLVGTGIVRLALEKNVTDWIARDQSPNLFWALADLPSPFIDPSAVERVERAELAFTDQPYMAQALSGTLPADQWPQIIRFMVRLQHVFKVGIFDLDKTAEAEVDQEFKTLMATEPAEARKYLASNGMPQAQLTALSDANAVGLCWIQQYKLASDEQWKGWALPYPQAEVVLQSAQAQLNATGQANHNLLLQAFGGMALAPVKSRFTLARTDREIALMRIIEALRDYTARHGGMFPDSLDQITDLPIPVDPVTGKPFDFHREKNTVILNAPAPSQFSPASGIRYELTFANT